MQDWYNANKEPGVYYGWGRGQSGAYLAIWARTAWQAWCAAQEVKK